MPSKKETKSQIESVFRNERLFHVEHDLFKDRQELLKNTDKLENGNRRFVEAFTEELFKKASKRTTKFLKLRLGQNPYMHVLDKIIQQWIHFADSGFDGAIITFYVDEWDLANQVGVSSNRKVEELVAELNSLFGGYRVTVKYIKLPNVPAWRYFGIAFSKGGYKPTIWDHWKL